MSKKNRTFNLFDFENDAVDFNNLPEEESTNEEFFSIVNIFAQEETENVLEDAEEETEEDAPSGAQLSIFGNETTEEFFIENVVSEENKEDSIPENVVSDEEDALIEEDTKYVPSEFDKEEITEDIPDSALNEIFEEEIEEIPQEDSFETSFVAQEALNETELDEIEEIISTDDVIIEDADDANAFEVEEAAKELEINVLDQEAEFTVSSIDTDAFANVAKFENIKNTPVLENFETPYVFNGKNGPRIRYRLSLPSKRNAKKARALKSILSWSLTITLAVFIALTLRLFVFVIATVDGPSMMPTLSSGEKLFVSKCAYYFSDIERGDVIICEYNTSGYYDMYVKRVIGLGGDRIRVTDGILYVNDQVVEENYIKAPGNDIEEFFVPTDCIYVLGDNRRNSTDSEELGPISKDYVIGKVIFRFNPFTMMEEKS